MESSASPLSHAVGFLLYNPFLSLLFSNFSVFSITQLSSSLLKTVLASATLWNTREVTRNKWPQEAKLLLHRFQSKRLSEKNEIIKLFEESLSFPLVILKKKSRANELSEGEKKKHILAITVYTAIR